MLDGEPTGLTVALESPVRDRTFLTYLGVNKIWVPAMIPADALRVRRPAVLRLLRARPACGGEAGRGLLESARGSGARTFFDTAWDPGGFPAATRAEVRALLPWVDVFLPNEAEACALAGVGPGADSAPRASCRRSRADGWSSSSGPVAALAVGPGGAEIRCRRQSLTAADTTGAGDAFNAGLIRALADDSPWPDALDAAARFASSLISRPSGDRHRVASERRFD